MRTALLAAAGAFALTATAAAQTPPTATATMINAQGQEIGTARFTQTPHGVLIDAAMTGVAEGEHGFHVHETGTCDAAGGFQSADDHYAPGGHEHGYMAQNGPHAGDMPNQFVQGDGVLRAHVLNPNVSLEGGDAPLLDENGSALLVHNMADDYSSQPSGEAGDRLACGVIQRQ